MPDPDLDIQFAGGDWPSALEPLLSEILISTLSRFDLKAPALTVRLSSDDEVRDLNSRFRGKDKATNVLSFPASEDLAPYLGDIILADGVTRREAAEGGKRLEDHGRHLAVHGCLHLLGYDHMEDSEAEEMEALEVDILAGFGIDNPYLPKEQAGG